MSIGEVTPAASASSRLLVPSTSETASVASQAPVAQPQDWRETYARKLVGGDLIVLVGAMTAAQLGRFGLEAPQSTVLGMHLSYQLLGGVVAIAWWLALEIHRTRSPKVLGGGADEYHRVVSATWHTFALLAVLSLALKVDASRLYLASAFPLGLAGLLLHRKVARVRLHRARRRGEAISDVLVVGGQRSGAHLARWFAKHPATGYRVGGVWVPDSSEVDPSRTLKSLAGIPVMSTQLDLSDALTIAGASAVVVTDTEQLGPEALSELVWRLEGSGVDLFVSPNVLGVSPSRLHLHDFSNMPILQVAEPQYAGATRFGKTLFDRLGAAALLLVFAPVLVATALAVKLTSAGPVFYRQERVGRQGEAFDMIKFRSMRVGADAELEALLKLEGRTLAELPKLVRDPRVTRVGAFIRRYSIDELPQLLNVIKGNMSLVGPRPQRHFEVAQYDDMAARRLHVLPGMTGLWQVSGRSNLSFDEAIELDINYVANWSLTSDLIILWRTFRAVVASDGAY